ncbi:MAG: hypothetical protein J7502_12460 [Flavisolibacter sp.]|nr:hypothetical protein [Flavisolibacter sp.]
MCDISQDLKEGLNYALNEASILGLDLDLSRRAVFVTFSPIAILTDGTLPADNRFLFAFRKVGRIAASLTPERDGKALEFEPSQLSDELDEFKNEQIYGWEFIDNGEKLFEDWQDNKSFDLILSNDFDKQHTIDLFQEDKCSNKSIDLRIWFQNIDIYDSGLQKVSIQTFNENGKRGWDKLYESGWTTNDSDLGEKLKLQE